MFRNKHSNVFFLVDFGRVLHGSARAANTNKDEHKSCLSYMTLLGKNISERTYVPRYYKKYAPAGSRTRGTSMGGLYVTATLLALLHRSGLRRTRRDCVIFPLL